MRMEDYRVAWVERYERSTALVEDACIRMGGVVIEVDCPASMGAGEDLEPAVHLVRAIEGDHQVRPAVFRDRVTLLPGNERRVLVPRKAGADPGRLQVDLIENPARRAHADRLDDLQDPPVVAEEGHLHTGRRRKRDLSQRPGMDRVLTSAAARGLDVITRAVDLAICDEVRTFRRELVARRAK